MNRELFLSLGITILTAATLFMYFRHRFKVMEHKVNTIFQLVQNHAKTQQNPPMRIHQPMGNRVVSGSPLNIPSVPEQNKIEVSDDEYTDTDCSSDSDDDTNSIHVNQQNTGVQNINLNEEIKQISVTLETDSQAPINLEEKKDLDDMGSLDDDDESVEEEAEEEEEAEAEEEAEFSHVVEETPDYAKMTVVELKRIASKNGITGYNKLRKQGLVDILTN